LRIGLVLLFLAFAALDSAEAQGQRPPLAVEVAAGGAARIAVGDVLGDPALEQTARSGLPLRLRFRVELWRDRLFDQLVEQTEWTAVLLLEPLDDHFLLARPEAGTLEEHPDFRSARIALETAYPSSLRPSRPGRYYYLASLQVESLTLSDLEEVANWLRGELSPAVQGQRSGVGALGSGLQRVIVRVLDLPTRRYTARSERFDVR
jgi:hypothetical protein